jgi:hypothetical protein
MRKTKNTNGSKLNALRTGAYSREILLPWENAAEYEKHCAEVFEDVQAKGKIQIGIATDLAENRWLRERQRRTTAIGTRRHRYSDVLNGARSWQDVLLIVSKRPIENGKTLQSIVGSMEQIIALIKRFAQESETTDQILKDLRKIIEQHREIYESLARIEAAGNTETAFFSEYAPKLLERRIGLENALDAQYDKISARLVIAKEATRMREEEQQQNVEPAAVAKVMADESETDDDVILGSFDPDDLDHDATGSVSKPAAPQ